MSKVTEDISKRDKKENGEANNPSINPKENKETKQNPNQGATKYPDITREQWFWDQAVLS